MMVKFPLQSRAKPLTIPNPGVDEVCYSLPTCLVQCPIGNEPLSLSSRVVYRPGPEILEVLSVDAWWKALMAEGDTYTEEAVVEAFDVLEGVLGKEVPLFVAITGYSNVHEPLWACKVNDAWKETNDFTQRRI